MADDWTRLEFGHIKDWTPLSDPPDPKSFESDDGFLSSLYNIPNTIKKKMDLLLGGSTSAKEDIQGLSKRVRIDNLTPDPVRDEQVKQQQSKDPLWKRTTRVGVDTLANVAKGQLGIQPNEDETPFVKFANKMAQSERENDPYLSQLNEQAGIDDNQLQGGLPWLESTEGKPIYRGSTRYHEKLDPAKYDTNDVLGWMTHGTPEGPYASEYAMGTAKHGTPHLASGDRPHVDVIKSDAQNVLDLVNPNADDIAQAIAQLDPATRESQIQQWKFARRNPEEAKRSLSQSHYPNPELIPDEEVPVRTIAEHLYLKPEEWKKSPFDATKYRDMGHIAYAVPPETQVRGFWSNEPLTDVPKPIQVVKQVGDEPIGPSSLEVIPKSKPTPYEPFSSWGQSSNLTNKPTGWGPNEGIDDAKNYLGQKVKIIPNSGNQPFEVHIKNQTDLNELQHHINMGSTIEELDQWGVPKSEQVKSWDQYDPNEEDLFNENYFNEKSLSKPHEANQYLGKKVNVKLGMNEFDDTVTPENLDILKQVLDSGGEVNVIKTPEEMIQHLKKPSAWEQLNENKKLQKQLLEDYNKYPGLNKLIESDPHIYDVVTNGLSPNAASNFDLVEKAKNYIEKVKDELINKNYSKYKIEDMTEFGAKSGVGPNAFKNLQEFENHLESIPVEIPNFGLLDYSEAKYILPTHLLQHYFW